MTEAMQKAQCREMAKVGKAMQPNDQASMASSLSDDVIIIEFVTRFLDYKGKVEKAQETLKEMTSTGASCRGLGRLDNSVHLIDWILSEMETKNND